MSPRHVSILKQANAEAPSEYLVRAGSSAGEARPGEATNSSSHTVDRAADRMLARRALSLSESADHAALDEMLRGLVGEAVRRQRGSERNRVLFLAAVLSADAACADSLGGSASAAQGLCDAICDARRLSATERQWALVAVAQLAARPCALPQLLSAGLPRRLHAVLSGEVDVRQWQRPQRECAQAETSPPPPPPPPPAAAQEAQRTEVEQPALEAPQAPQVAQADEAVEHQADAATEAAAAAAAAVAEAVAAAGAQERAKPIDSVSLKPDRFEFSVASAENFRG